MPPIEPTKPFSGRTVLVTGASSGMGAEIAQELARQGADVAAVARDETRLGAVVDEIEATGVHALAIQADLTSDGAARDVVDQVIDRFSALDHLVNAAGIYRPSRFVDALEDLDAQWAINVRAPFVLTQAAIPHIRARPGSVLFVGSIAGTRSFPDATGYCTTKGAVNSLVSSLAVEEAQCGVRVNAICPGEIATAMNVQQLEDPAFVNAVLDATPLRRIGQVAEIAPAAAFLLSDAASYITGARLAVDGGWAAA